MNRLPHHNLWRFVKAVCLYAVLLVGLFGVVFGPVLTTHAEPSYTINYQGKLTDASNVAVTNGSYTMVFKLYTTATGGSPIWTETRNGANKVTVTSGLFSVMLGSITSLTSVNFNQPLYLGVTIESDSETQDHRYGTICV
jgi:protein-S-isoprenylcysteine O-methyltransferase Ste14